MAIIYSYPGASNLLATDTLIGTTTAIVNGTAKNLTRSFSIDDIFNYVVSNVTIAGTIPSLQQVTSVAANTNLAITTTGFIKTGGTSSQFLMANGSVKFIVKSNESLLSVNRTGDVLSGILDQYTGQEMTLSKVLGTPTVDNVIYFQVGGEYFKRNVTGINPAWFGAKGDGVTNDTAAVQSFFDYIQSENVGIAYCNGRFLISSGIIMGRTAEMLTKHIIGSPIFTTSTVIETMLTVRSCPGLVWDGKISVTGIGATSYASRTCRVGVTLAGQGVAPSSRMRFGGFVINSFQQVGLNVQNLSTLTDLGNIKVTDCGSGASGFSLLSNWSNKVNTGLSGSSAQRSKIDVTVLPPDNFTGGRNPNCFVVINDETYYVYDIDRAASTLTVFPFIDNTIASGSLRYLFGGGVFTFGGDAGILGATQIDAMRCSFGLLTTALYGPIVSRMVTQFCGVGLGFGSAPEAASVTFQVNGLYCEGNDYDILRATRATVGGIINSSYALNLKKIRYTGDARVTDTNQYLNAFNNMRSITVYQDGIGNRCLQNRRNGSVSGSFIILDLTTSPLHNQFKKNSQEIRLAKLAFQNNDAFGYCADTITFVGSGNNYAPTGTFTFVAPGPVTTNGSGIIGSVNLEVGDDGGISLGQTVTGTGIAVGATVAGFSGNGVILSAPLTATIVNSAITFTDTTPATVNGSSTVNFSGFNGPAVFNVHYDFALNTFIVGTTSVGSFPSTTASLIANKANVINTQNKYLGRGVFDTTNNRLMIASGSTDVSPWYVADGSASVTPA